MPGNPMLRHQLTGSGAGTPKVKGVVKEAVKEAADWAVDKAINVLDAPFEARELGKKMRRKSEDKKAPRHRPVKDEREVARRTILPGPPGESLPGDRIGRTPERAPE